MASLKTECRKFSPNIFNKSKCQNCFRGKDAHSSEALESNRATRKVSCCGYLFVAPDWDFSLPANRNKRWQRRWFVLYDDGELAYSVDEHPETVPQAVIDMNCVLEVADAENVTGNPFALAVTCPDKVHFIKGTGKDESKKWFEVLSKFPRNTVCGKYKRNATFPCIKSTPVVKIETPVSSLSNRRDTVDMSSSSYAKHNGCSLTRGLKQQSAGVAFDPDDDVFPTKDTNSSSVLKIPQRTLLEDKKKQEISTPLLNESNLLRNNLPDPICDAKTYLKQQQDSRKSHSRSDVSRMHPSSPEEKTSDWRRSDITRLNSSSSEDKSSDWRRSEVSRIHVSEEKSSDWRRVEGGAFHNNPVYLMMADVPPGKKIENYENYFNREKPRMLRRQSSFGKKSDLQKQLWSEESGVERTIHKSASVPNAVLREDNKNVLLNGNGERAQLKSSLSQIRGDPDGCNLDSMPSYCASKSEFTTEQSNEFLKKGWLVKQDSSKWNKYWFVLRNSALTYFSDPIAEDAGILDGFLDLRKVRGAAEVESSSGHTFCIMMKDLSKLYLSAVTAKIRNNWIRAILQAANLDPPRRPTKTPADCPSEDCPTPKRNTPEDPEDCPANPPEEERRGALPPSPPLARTAISRVKERAKTRSNSRTRSPKLIASQESDLLVDSDDGTTDHSSSSLLNNTVGMTPLKEKKSPKELPPKSPQDEKPPSSSSKPERRRSFRDFQDGRKKVTDIKDKLEDSSWTIWLDISKFCKEVESKLDDLEDKASPASKTHLSGEQRREVGTLVSSLGRVEDRLHRVHGELEKAKTALLLRDTELGAPLGKVGFGCSSLQREVSRLSGISAQNALLAHQLNGAREENRRLKAEVKKSQDSSDDFELACASLRKAGEQADQLHRSHMQLMAARVDDLTGKLLASEKCVRQLRLRVAKLEQRQERRRSSLKGKEALTLSKEYEAKLAELEAKIQALEGTGSQEAKSQSLLGRLHSLDRKVKDVTEAAAQEESSSCPDRPPKPKIRLQVNLNENTPQEDWNSLSLSTSMTDLTAADETCEMKACCEEDSLSLSFGDCLESLGHKVSSLVSWLKTSLQLLYAQGHMNPFQASKIDFEASEELSKLVRTLEFVTGKMEDTPQGLSCVVSKLLYNIILLQEVTNIVFKMSDFGKYKATVLVQHLNRVKQAIGGIEQYIEQKSNPVSSSVQKISLCNVVSCLLFYKSSLEEEVNVSDVNILFEEVDSKKKHISSVLAEFKEKFIERFCATIIELSEDSGCDNNNKGSPQKSPTDPKSDPKPLGQKQFLAHISHIISQVSQSFITHVSKSLNEVYFLCSSLQYGEKWTDYICRLLQQELSLLSSEIKSICVQHLENSFFSSSKCGVLVEYMHCSISELAQIVAIVTVVDGTVVLIKDALHSEGPASITPSSDSPIPSSTTSNDLASATANTKDRALSAFHESLQLRAAGTLANLPGLRFSQLSPSPCGPSELGVAHRSVSSLLCFKRKWMLQQQGGECRGCFELRQEVSYLQGELEESRAAAGGRCERCRQGELAWREHVQEVVKEKDKQFEAEKEKLEQELHVAQNNIKSLEHHYDEELRKLQHLYEQKLQQKNEHVREDIKLRYSDEIEQLKCLCERGLSAMEASHQKIVRELEIRHQGELEDVMADRERALAEEAHATAIALEAVRKAHSEELQKQIQKFKDEFVHKMNKRFETEAFKKCYESDLSNVKSEILLMAEKYSVKCLENATLQEKLEVMNQQLKSTTTQVVELLAKNQQLQARLTSDTLQKQEESII